MHAISFVHSDITQTFTVRKISNRAGVDRMPLFYSPAIDKICLDRKGRIHYIRVPYLNDLKDPRTHIFERCINFIKESAPATEPAATQ